MRSFKLLALTLASVLALPAVAMADTGLYIDGAVGRASVDDNGIDDNDTSFRIGAGWRFLENFGSEIGYQDLGKMSEEIAVGGATASISADGLYAGIAGKIPLYDGETGFYVGARGGLLFWNATGRIRQGNTSVRLDDSASDFYVGVSGGYEK